jgi:phage-related protein (TIGR01555 family)
MSRSRYKPKHIESREHAVAPPVKVSAADSFQNVLGRLGADQPNLASMANYVMNRLTRDYNLLNVLYRNSWIIKKIVNIIPEDMVKNWVDLTTELTPEQTDRYKKLERRTKVREKILEGLYWGRLYGGAGALIMIDGHEGILDQPLDLDQVMPNSFCGLMVLDRWTGIFPSSELISDPRDPEFGMPKYYEVRDTTKGTAARNPDNKGSLVLTVHHSRIIRFTGRKLPFLEEQAEMYWGASEIEHVKDELDKRNNTSWNIASLVFQANLLINKVQGLDQINSLADPQMQRDFYNVKSAQNQMRSNQGMMMIGPEDDLQAIQYTFAGLNDIYESFMMDVAGASDIPVTRLFGRSPAGMNSTGESDLQNYYDMISQQQEAVLKPKLNKLLPVMFMSEFGYVPADLDTKANPIRTMSDKEVADLIDKKAEAVGKAYDRGIISQKCAISELHEMSYNTNMFTSITDEDIEAADATMKVPGEFGVGGDPLDGLLGSDSSNRNPVQTKPAIPDELGLGTSKPVK